MVKILSPKRYEAWVRNTLLKGKRSRYEDIRIGKLYLGLYEDENNVQLGSFSAAPIILPLFPFGSGFYGANLTSLPSKRLRKQILERYIEISNMNSIRLRSLEARKYLNALSRRTITKNSVSYFKLNNFKSHKIVEVELEDVEGLIRNVL